jgi:uncharacterized protein YciI
MSKLKLTKNEVLAASGTMLKKQVYVVFTSATHGLEEVMACLPAHLEHQAKMEREGIMVAAGPNWADDEDTWEGDGMFVIRANSLTEATQIAASDPMHQSGARSFKVRPWLINEGCLNIHVTFSDGKMTLD